MSTLATQLKKMYWQQSGRYNPIIRDGLVVYEPFDVYREKTLVGNFPLNHRDTYANLQHKGIACARGVSYQSIPLGLEQFTISQWCCAFINMCSAFAGYYRSASNQMFVSTQIKADKLWICLPNANFEKAMARGTWFHVCFTRTSLNAVSVYIDGDLIGTRTNANALTDSALTWTTQATGAYSVVAGARIYNRALLDSEIQQLAHEFTPTA